MFAKAGIPEAQAEAAILALSAGDEEARDRLRAVRTSYDRIRSGLVASGFTRLRELLPPDALGFVDRQLQAVSRATATLTVKSSAKAVDEQDDEPEYDAPPATAFYGWFGDYAELMEPTSEAAVAFHLGAGLTLAGAMIGKRVRTDYASNELYANLYTVLIGATGRSRKDTAINRATALPQLMPPGTRIIVPPFHLVKDISSAEGLIAILKDQNNLFLHLTELSTLIRNARRKATNTILPRLIEAWDTPPVLQNLNKNNPIQARNPFLSIAAATQPKTLAAEMTDEDIHSGFANRWLYIVGSGKAPLAVAPSVDKALAWRLYLRLHDAIQSHGEGASLPLLPEAHPRWTAWYLAQAKDSGRDEDEGAMRVRLASLAQKIALIYAVSDGAAGIGDKHMEAALSLVDWSWGHVKTMLRQWGIGIDSKIEQRILTVLRQQGAIQRRHLQMKCANRKWSARDFAGVLRAMVENGTVLTDPTGLVALADGGPV
jgi:hypothetical protein